MKDLEELEKKYVELGKEIERLKKEKSCKRWRANLNDEYYCLYSAGYIDNTDELEEECDDFRYKTRNYFKTEEEAQKHLDNINIYYDLMDLADELNGDKRIDWNDDNQGKYFIKYDFDGNRLIRDANYFYKNLGQIYCLDEDFLRIALERIGKDRLEKLFVEGY